MTTRQQIVRALQKLATSQRLQKEAVQELKQALSEKSKAPKVRD